MTKYVYTTECILILNTVETSLMYVSKLIHNVENGDKLLFYKGPFNNYVDKMRGEGVKKYLFLSSSGYKNRPSRGGREGVKKWQKLVHIVVE